MDEPKAALRQSLHAVHGILEGILSRISDDCAQIGGSFDLEDGNDDEDELQFLALEGRNVHELAMEVQLRISGCMETQRKEKSRMEARVSSLLKENQDIHSILKAAIKGNDDGHQGRSAILQIAERGLQKVGFGFIMDVISGEPASTSCGTKSEQEVISLESIVENTIKTLHHEISNLRQTLEESRSDCEHFQLLATEKDQKIMRYESNIKELEERESFMVHRVEELALRMKAVEQEAARWRQACELEVEAGKCAIKELNQEIYLLREELVHVKSELKAANSKLHLKEKLAACAMAAQAAAEACLKLADRRSAGLQQKIEELTRQIEQEELNKRKEEESTSRRLRYVCWPWQQLHNISSSSHAKTWYVDQNGRLLPRTEALLQIRI